MINQLETIEKYLSDAMDLEEKSRFEQRMKDDAEFAKEVEKTKQVFDELKAFHSRRELKSKLNQFHSTLFHENNGVNNRNGKFNLSLNNQPWLMAASIALIFGLGVFSYLRFTKYSERSQYQELRSDLEHIQQTQKKLWRAIKEEQKSIGSNGFGGTAFVISSNGYLITSYHVVKDAAKMYVHNSKYQRLEVQCVQSDKNLDIAVLKVIGASFVTFGKLPYGIGKSIKGLGNEVYTLGFPKADIVYGEGYISSLSGYGGDTTAYQMAIPVNPGNSGAPVFDGRGNIVGMVNGKHREEEGAAFALKAQYIKRFVKTLKIKDIKLPKSSSRASSRANQIAKVQPYVFQVEVYE